MKRSSGTFQQQIRDEDRRTIIAVVVTLFASIAIAVVVLADASGF